MAEDCLGCRLVSGGGLLGLGLYVAHQGGKLRSYNKWGMFLISAGFTGLGTARLLNLPPFGRELSTEGK